MKTPKTKEQFEKTLEDNIVYFAKSFENVFKSNLEIPCNYNGVISLAKPETATEKIYISVFYTGTVYGEFIISLDEKTAKALIHQSPLLSSFISGDITREDIISIFSEYLNIICGDCIAHLAQSFEQLSITAPRAIFGTSYYPNLKMVTATITSPVGDVHCHFYVDSMGLDISRAYNKSLEDLTDAYYDLEKAMHRLQKQQDIIVQAEKMAALGKMAAGVAHEINNPLAIIALTNSNLRRQITPLETKLNIAHMIDRIDTTVARITKITDGMRTFAGNVHGKTEIISLSESLKLSAVALEDKLKSNSIDVKIDIPEGLLVNGKKDLLHETFVHLFENSIEEIKEQEKKWIHIVGNESNGVIQVDFIDSGEGIDPSITDKIFDPFFTTHELVKKGLGLCVVKGVLVDHGASIEVIKNAKNTTFLMTFPKAA